MPLNGAEEIPFPQPTCSQPASVVGFCFFEDKIYQIESDFAGPSRS
jgi:hypothetical protein